MADPILIPNTFSSYKLDEDQEIAGCILTTEQKCVIQNRISEIAAQQLGLEYDVSNPESFIQLNGYLKGQIEILSWLIDQSNAVASATYQTIEEE